MQRIAHALNKYGTLMVMALGLCVYVIHMQHSNIAGFGRYISWVIDSYGHLEYITILANTLSIPAPSACWECHQPPLYYMLAAYPYTIAQDFSLMSPVLAVRLFSLPFYLGFLFFGARLLAMEIHSRPVYYIGLCLLVFWPYGITKAAMISNDVPLYMAEAGALYYILRWRRDRVAANLALAILWNGIAIGFKYSGIIITPFIGCIFLSQYCKKCSLARQLLSKPVIAGLCISLILAGATFARTYYHYRIENHSSLPLLVPSVPVVIKHWPVSNDRLEYFVLPDFRRYIKSPFLTDSIEKRYFLNFVLKSSLFGMKFWTPVKTAYVLQMLMLSMLTYITCSLLPIIRNRAYLPEVFPLLAFIIMQLSALVTYRIIYPHSGNQDYRFIYPVTIAMAVLYAKTLSWHQAQGKSNIFRLGVFLAAGFTCTSIIFILLNSWG